MLPLHACISLHEVCMWRSSVAGGRLQLWFANWKQEPLLCSFESLTRTSPSLFPETLSHLCVHAQLFLLYCICLSYLFGNARVSRHPKGLKVVLALHDLHAVAWPGHASIAHGGMCHSLNHAAAANPRVLNHDVTCAYPSKSLILFQCKIVLMHISPCVCLGDALT